MTKEIEHLVVPEEVLQNLLAYTRLPESSDRIFRRLEYEPGHFELHIYRIPCFDKNGKRSKAGLDAPIYAAAPQGILPGSNMGASSSALALHNKYSLHFPLYRQIKELERIGLQGVSEVCSATGWEPPQMRWTPSGKHSMSSCLMPLPCI